MDRECFAAGKRFPPDSIQPRLYEEPHNRAESVRFELVVDAEGCETNAVGYSHNARNLGHEQSEAIFIRKNDAFRQRWGKSLLKSDRLRSTPCPKCVVAPVGDRIQ